MRKLIIVLLCLRLSLLIAFAQTGAAPQSDEKPTVESVDVTGVAESRITRDLRDLMHELVGQKFDQLAADEVASHIQNELSEHVSAIRQLPGTDSDRIKLVFEIGPVVNEDERHANVNSRYTVEDVELQGVPESTISAGLREDMHKLAGEKLDQDRAGEIEKRLSRELGSSRVVSRKVVKGSNRDHVRLIYEVEKAPFLRYEEPGSYILAHSKQSFSFRLDADVLDQASNRLSVGVVNDGDQLIERYAGYFVRLQNIKAGTRHLGFRLEYFNYHEKWKAASELALESRPEVPAIYRERRGFEPTVTIALDRRLNVSLGASVQEMQIQYPAIHFQNSNAGVAALNFQDSWKTSDSVEHRLVANYLVRSASHSLDSDFIYTRHLGEVQYDFSSHHNEFVATSTVGAITGTAPLFERFSLGNTSTLRGWNKYDLAPVGGDRLAYGSLEYRYTELQVYYDVGTVWDQGGVRKTTHAVGFGVHGRKDDNWFFTMGVPIRSGRIQPLKPIFMLGVHF